MRLSLQLRTKLKNNVQERATQVLLINVQTSSHSREIPDRVDSGLVDIQLTRLVDYDTSIDLETSIAELLLQLGYNHVGTGDGDSGAHIESLLDLGLVVLAGQMAKGVHGYDLGGV